MVSKDDQKTFQLVDGIAFPLSFNGEVIRSAMNYVAKAGDIFILTYPKSGTTWMETIVFGLLNNGRAFDDDFDYYMKQTPFLELQGKDAVEKMTHPGSITTHLPFDRVPYHPQAKYICVIRNPKDICVSFYHFIKNVPSFGYADNKFETFFDTFVSGKTPHGDYSEYMKKLWPHKDDDNVLLVSYEQMYHDLAVVIHRVAQFVEIEPHPRLLERVLTCCSFTYMKENYDRVRKSWKEKHCSKVELETEQLLEFVRKGVPGDWPSCMTKEQATCLDDIMTEMVKSMPGLKDYWFPGLQ